MDFKNTQVMDFKTQNVIKCIYTNADQLRNKLDELKLRASENPPGIIGITEVKPKKNTFKMSPAEFSLDEVAEYDMFSLNQQYR